MSFFRKALLKLEIETNFFLIQKWGIKKVKGQLDLPKYILKKYLPHNPIIVDCGAHVGSDSVELSRIFPKSKIHSFEPIPEVFNRLKHNTRKRSNITCYPVALSDENGTAEMYVSSGSSDGSSSLLQPKEHLNHHTSVFFNDTITVSTMTIDAWAERNNIERVDFLWLDMQGFEFQMLQASTKILPTVKAIHTEVNTKELYSGAKLYSDFRKWLETKGFEVVIELPDSIDMCNVLFVRR